MEIAYCTVVLRFVRLYRYTSMAWHRCARNDAGIRWQISVSKFQDDEKEIKDKRIQGMNDVNSIYLKENTEMPWIILDDKQNIVLHCNA